MFIGPGLSAHSFLFGTFTLTASPEPVPSMLPIALILVASASFSNANGVSTGLQRRTGQTSATCTSDTSWMDNSQNNSPCQVVAQLNAICNAGTWTVAALNSSLHYDNPNPAAGTATFCTCSWASYNLISACIACQNTEFQSKITVWTDYSSLCSGRLSTTYFPSNITLPEGLTIPFWAGQDPTTWTNGKFNVGAAQTLANENKPDLGQAPVSQKKSSHVGAIVGGVIGGLVVIAAAIAAAFYILRQQRKPVHFEGTMPLSDAKHMRSMSDVTTGSTRAYTTLSSTPLNVPTSPTIMTHNTSVMSVPYLSSMVTSTAPYGTTASPPPRQQVASPPPGNREDIIVPFTDPPASNANHDRKQSNGSGYPIYEDPNAPPPGGARMEITRPVTPNQGTSRGRYNPPTYSESTTKGRAGHRGKQESTDTLQSVTSSRAHGTRPTLDHSPSSSGSGMANIVGQMTAANNHPTGSGSASGHGRQVGGSRDEKRPIPEDGSFSARDIA